MWINAITGQIFSNHYEIRQAFPNVSFPSILSDENMVGVDVYPVALIPSPKHDPITQKVNELSPLKIGEGVYEQAWEIIELDPETIAVNQAKKAEHDAKTVADKIEQLWQSADKYVTGYISGVAIGILTIGVLQGKPKAQAISAWSNQVWAEYYNRKEAITVDSPLDLDFSSFGAIPYTIPELQAEVFA